MQILARRGTEMPNIIPSLSCLSANIAAALKSNSELSSLGSLHPYAFKANTRNEYRYSLFIPDIIQYVSK